MIFKRQFVKNKLVISLFSSRCRFIPVFHEILFNRHVFNSLNYKMEYFGLFLTFALLCSTSAVIVPNEIPTILSLVYSNIPPLKIGQDTRFGLGFRLGPHADFQTLIELGPQTNTGKIAEDAPAKREQPPLPTQRPVEEKKSKKATAPKKAQMIDKIVFKKVPGIDD